MDIYDHEIVKFWRAMNGEGVRYILMGGFLMGGFATNLHGFQRFTGDMDLLIEDTFEKRKRLRKAFNAYGSDDLEMLETIPFIPDGQNFYLDNGFTINILHLPLKGLENYDFETCYQNASIAEIADVEIHFLHINHLIENKKAVNRPKDQVDVIELEKIRELRNRD